MTATRMGRVGRFATITLLLALFLLAAAWLWRTEVPDGLRLPEVNAASEFTPAERSESAAYARVQRLLWVGATLAQLLALGILAAAGPRLAGRLPGGRTRRALTLLTAALVAGYLARLPFAATAQWWRRRHGLSRAGYLDWLTAPWLELLAGVLLAAVALLLAALLARRLGPRWWLAGGPALALLGAGVILLQPLVLAPRLEPLRDADLAAEIRALARRTGAGPVGVEVKDASERTTVPNAEVAGIGPTRRIVLWDTLLDGRFTPGEIRFVAAHELAHVGRRHLWKGLGWLALLALPCTYVLARVTGRRGGVDEPAAVPLAVLAVVAIQLALLPLSSAISRRYEAEADWTALEVTRDPAAARRVFHRFSETSLAQPEPPGWSYALRSTHPSLLERIAMTRAWARGRSGPSRSGEAPRAGS